MTEAEQLAQAQAAARAGDFKLARELLTPLAKSSPKAQKWLHQINDKIAAEALAAKDAPPAAPVAKPVDLSKEIAKGIKQAKEEEKQQKAKQQGIALILSIILVVSCCSWLSYLGQAKPEENVAKMCALVRSVNFQCDPDEILRIYPHVVEYCQETYGNFVDVDELKYTWQNCMRSQGVEFQPNP